MPRKRSVTIRETTAREVTVAEEHDDTQPVELDHEDPAIPWAPGWDHDTITHRQEYREQRVHQQDRCLQFLWNAVESGEMTAEQTGDWAAFTHQLPTLIRSAKVILRAGPGATPLELTTGMSV